jgi:hypothetical protein
MTKLYAIDEDGNRKEISTGVIKATGVKLRLLPVAVVVSLVLNVIQIVYLVLERM